MQRAMSALGQSRTLAWKWKLGTLQGAVTFNAQAERRYGDDQDKRCSEPPRTSIEPSPLSGEKPKWRSIKSIGAALLRSTQSTTAPQTAIIKPKPISTGRALRSTASLYAQGRGTQTTHCVAQDDFVTIGLRDN